MNDVNEFLEKHRVKKEKGFSFTEYDNLKATLIASMDGTVLYNDEMFLYGKKITEILRP